MARFLAGSRALHHGFSIQFSAAAGTATAAWSGSLPVAGTNADVEIDLDFDLSHDNAAIVPVDTESAISVSPRGISIVAIIEQIDDDGMLFLRIDGTSTVMVESSSDFFVRLGSCLRIESTVKGFRLTPFGSP